MELEWISLFPLWLLALLTTLIPLVSADIDELYRELKDSAVPEMWTTGSSLVNRIMAGAEKVAVNTRAYLIPRWTSPGGDARANTFDGSAFANGTNPFTDQMSVSAIGCSVSFSATELMIFATRNDKVAVRKFMARYDAGLLREMKEHMEGWLNANSNDGIAAILSGVQNTTEYIMNSVSDRYGGYLLRPGGSYQIIASAGFPATVRANGPHRILPDGTGLNKRLNPPIVSFAESNGSTAAAIAGFTAEDRVVFFGFGNAGFSSIGHLVSSAATGTVQGVSRAVPHNRPTRIDGASGSLNAGLVRRLYADIFKYKGDASAMDGLLPYCSQDQIVAWLESAQAVSGIRLTDADGGSIGDIYDRYIGDLKGGSISNKKPLISGLANPEQFRFIRLSDFLWVTLKDIGFEPNDAGGKLHRQHNASGDALSAFSVHVTYHGNLAFRDVSGMGVIYGLNKPLLGD